MKFSVIGLGKLGSPLAAVLASKGHQVVGVDTNEDFVKKINQGLAPVKEPQLQELIDQNRSNFKATLSYQEAIVDSEATFVIIPTPSDEDGLFSNKYILQALEKIGGYLASKDSYHLVVITSTVTPGSTHGVIKEALERSSGKLVGKDIGLCYNPEFIALGSVVRDMLYPDMVLIGESDERAGDLLESIYKTICGEKTPIQRMNLTNAEIAKISINTFVTTKISYANMLADICERVPDADVDVVTQAVGLDSRIGSKYLKGSVAFGGPCFPRDNVALAAFAKKNGARADLALATQSINDYQNTRMLSIIRSYASSKNVGILGLSYKPGTCVVEESPGIRLANDLVKESFNVFVYDPQALVEATRSLDANIEITSSIEDCLSKADTIILMIPWPEFATINEDTVRGKVVIDCWRILPLQKFEQVSTLVHPGKNSEAFCGQR